jgi:outer membrane lipoprotein
MSRALLAISLVGGLLILSACAESAHQIEQASGHLGVSPELERQVDHSVKFADLRAAPTEYIGRVVTVGGIVIASKRTKEQTEIEILELPTRSDGPSTTDRLQSEGRFLAIREEFLDPARVPAGTPVTIIGVVKGAVARPLDESEYIYPVLDIKHLIDWNAVASRDSGSGAAGYYGPYYPPYGFWISPYGYYPYLGRPYPFFAPGRSFSSPPPPPANIHPRLRRK